MILNKATISFSAIINNGSSIDDILANTFLTSLSLSVSFHSLEKGESIEWWLSNCSNGRVRWRKFSFVSISVFSIDYIRSRIKVNSFQRISKFSISINCNIWNISFDTETWFLLVYGILIYQFNIFNVSFLSRKL